jgi:hypothetical protein
MADLPFGQKETFPISWRLRAERAEAEVRALTARLDALDSERLGAWLMEHRGWDTADVDELTEAIRAATADPTPQTDDDT